MKWLQENITSHDIFIAHEKNFPHIKITLS